MRRPLLDAIKLSVRIPRGRDGFWRIIREIDQAGAWTIADIDGASNVHESTVKDFVWSLVRGGIAEAVGVTPAGAKTYRLRKRPAETPLLRRDGTALPPPAQQRMWTAMRSLRQFAVKEMAYAAADDRGAVSAVTAKRYVAHLVAAGYLAAVDAGGPGKPATWRLRPAMNTGPRAPRILRVHIVFDANRGAVIGEQVAAEEARP
jgi:hypothetical protein